MRIISGKFKGKKILQPKDKNLRNILTNIYSMKILNNDGLIIVHRHKREGDVFPDFLSVIEEKTYGIAKIIFLTVNLD